MKKVLILFAAMTMGVALSSNAKIFEENHFTINANVGGASGAAGFGLGVAFQTQIVEASWITLDWDVLHFQWSAPFDSPANSDNLSFKTGVRGYSPSFANDHLRVYSNLDLGYVLGLAKDWNDDMATSSGFGLTWGAGLQLNKKWSLGYTLEYANFSGNGGTSHYGTIAFTF